MLGINTNISSLVAQRSLTNSTQLLNKTIERMSTGFKINHAADNAANYSISTDMTTRIGAYQVAEDNTAMGLELIATANESLDLINDRLVRLRALAEQAANGTYGEQSLKAINAEASALVSEIQRSYSNTEYNDIKLFGETGGSFLQKVEQRDTSEFTALADVDENSPLDSGTYSISTLEELNKLSRMAKDGGFDNIEIVLANNIDAKGQELEPIGSVKEEFSGIFDGNGYTISNAKLNNNGFIIFRDNDVKNLGLENVTVVDLLFTGVGESLGVSNTKNCYAIVNYEGVNKPVWGADSSNCYIISDKEVPGRSGLQTLSFSDYLKLFTVGKSNITNLQVGINSSASSSIEIDTAFSLAGVSLLGGIGLNNMDYMGLIDDIIANVSAKQTEYGACQNRLESALEEISTQYENLVSSRSTLRDADITKVSSEYIKQQILQQASATLLSTANQTPALALQLI